MDYKEVKVHKFEDMFEVVNGCAVIKNEEVIYNAKCMVS